MDRLLALLSTVAPALAALPEAIVHLAAHVDEKIAASEASILVEIGNIAVHLDGIDDKVRLLLPPQAAEPSTLSARRLPFGREEKPTCVPLVLALAHRHFFVAYLVALLGLILTKANLSLQATIPTLCSPTLLSC